MKSDADRSPVQLRWQRSLWTLSWVVSFLWIYWALGKFSDWPDNRTRLERWERAEALDLDPPPIVSLF